MVHNKVEDEKMNEAATCEEALDQLSYLERNGKSLHEEGEIYEQNCHSLDPSHQRGKADHEDGKLVSSEKEHSNIEETLSKSSTLSEECLHRKDNNVERNISDDYSSSSKDKDNDIYSNQNINQEINKISSTSVANNSNDNIIRTKSYSNEEQQFIEQFWKRYDDIIILSIFSLLGILFRLMAASFFHKFDDVFNEKSALFTNLPLNCLSCFIMGIFSSGEDAAKIIFTRFNVSGARTNFSRSKSMYKLFEDESRSTAEDDPEATSDLWRKGLNCNKSNDDLRKRHLGHLNSNPNSNQMKSDELDIIRDSKRLAKEEMREAHIKVLERRILDSSSLLLFPSKKKEVDVMAHYFDEEMCNMYKTQGKLDMESKRCEHLESNENNSNGDGISQIINYSTSESKVIQSYDKKPISNEVTQRKDSFDEILKENQLEYTTTTENDTHISSPDQEQHHSYDQIFVTTAQNFKQFTKVNVADGWDVGTTPEAMKNGILLGLRVGFCGALVCLLHPFSHNCLIFQFLCFTLLFVSFTLSFLGHLFILSFVYFTISFFFSRLKGTFSSWNSDMVNLFRNGRIDAALCGCLLGIQLPIIAYRFGQNAAIYIFVRRLRREKRKDERRGYGLRLRNDEENFEVNSTNVEEFDIHNNNFTMASNRILDEKLVIRKKPSIRAIATAIFTMSLVSLLSSLIFFGHSFKVQRFSISLLCSPLGVLTRWKLSNSYNRNSKYPFGTFMCNVLGCVLSGSLGSLLAGNPASEERIVLVSIIAGFAGKIDSNICCHRLKGSQ